jgi:hypothetical protein
MQHKLKVCLQAWSSQKAFATFDSKATSFWLGSYRVQPDKAVLHREVLWDQLILRCCIDRLSWQGKPDIWP